MSKKFFLTKQNHNNIVVEKDIDIILSPELYWVRVFDLPISSKKEAITVVANLFEEFFDTTNYKFYIIKLDNDKYLSFAYNEDEIIKYLKQNNIDYKKIGYIYFAQNEFHTINSVISIEESYYTYQDDIFVQIPSNIGVTLDCDKFDINHLELSNYKILLNRSSKYLDNKSAFLLSGLFIVLSLFIFTKTYILNNQLKQFPKKLEILQTKYHLMNSKIQTKSILQQYDKISKKYIRLREILEYITNFRKQAQGRLEHIELKNGIVNCYFKESSSNQLKSYFTNKYKNISMQKYSDVIKIGIKL